MRVGIDLFALVPNVGRGAGFHRYVRSLVRALNGLDDAHTYHLLVNSLSTDLFPSNDRVVQHVVPLPPQRERWPVRLLWQHTLLPRRARRLQLDMVHFPMDTASISLPCPYVVTIHDLISDVFYPEHFPRSQSWLKSRYLFWAKRRAARGARVVMCPSEATAGLLCQHYGIGRDKIRLVPYAADRAFFANGRHNGRPEPPYVLSVVSLSPHKNIHTLVEGFAAARARFDLPHELHIVGMRGTDADPIERYLAEQRARGIPAQYLGFVEDDDLRDAYARADVFVYLSLAEGFGLPPLEAMASGVPVIASDTSSIPEVCDGAARLVPPTDVEAVGTAIGEVLRKPETAAGLLQRGTERAGAFSWEATAALTVRVYEEAARAVR